ncbi:MAG TPA: FHA domain-containing protein [Methylophilaceae bacterium]|nr:FHA domain-containing protein [Methylophilaceae bacterium]
MAKLLFSLQGNFLGEFPLDKERVTIGRRPSNDIHIDNLAISGEHAVVKTIGKDAFLEDLGSTNGTLVNRKKVQQHILQDGDVIELGKYQLKYVASDVTGTATAKLASTVKATEQAPTAKVEMAAPAAPLPPAKPKAAAKPAEAEKRGKVNILTGPNKGKELGLDKALTTLGKPGLQVAVITRRHQGYFITHVEGQSHPLVNGKAIGVQAHALKNHDVIELAGVKMEFLLAQG